VKDEKAHCEEVAREFIVRPWPGRRAGQVEPLADLIARERAAARAEALELAAQHVEAQYVLGDMPTAISARQMAKTLRSADFARVVEKEPK
jgi:hypothetical protein